jgi:hypothetical protein
MGADGVEGIAQRAFADIERQPQKSDDVTAKLPECQEFNGVAMIESHTTSRAICVDATLPKAAPLSQSARSPTFCNPTLTLTGGERTARRCRAESPEAILMTLF